MGTPLRRRAAAAVSAPFERDPVGRLLDDLVIAAGDISPDEESLLAAIRKRLKLMERRKGRAAALEAAKRVRQNLASGHRGRGQPCAEARIELTRRPAYASTNPS